MAEDYFRGTGRRKEAVARVRLYPGSGRTVINGKSLDVYFPSRRYRIEASSPLNHLGLKDQYDVVASIDGGGISGQAGALKLGIARALVESDDSLRTDLKRAGYLRRDSRVKERKKYGLKSARKKPQFSKR